MSSIRTARTASATALASAAIMATVALAPAASALTTEDLPLVNGNRQGHLGQPFMPGEITDPRFGDTVPIELRPSIGCMGPDVLPEGEPREGLHLVTADTREPTSVGFLGSLTDPAVLLPTSDRLTVTWTNTDTGQSGESTVEGRNFGTELRINTGTGRVTGTAVLVSEGILGPIGLGSIGGGPHETQFDLDYTTVDCIP